MPDMVKVINALTLCTTQFDESVMVAPCKQCPYYTGRDLCDIRQMMLDTIELLKEQEEQIKTQRENFAHFAAKVAVQPEIVRCKDCRFFTATKFDADNYGHCRKDVVWKEVTTDWHCADGKRCEGH